VMCTVDLIHTWYLGPVNGLGRYKPSYNLNMVSFNNIIRSRVARSITADWSSVV